MAHKYQQDDSQNTADDLQSCSTSRSSSPEPGPEPKSHTLPELPLTSLLRRRSTEVEQDFADRISHLQTNWENSNPQAFAISNSAAQSAFKKCAKAALSSPGYAQPISATDVQPNETSLRMQGSETVVTSESLPLDRGNIVATSESPALRFSSSMTRRKSANTYVSAPASIGGRRRVLPVVDASIWTSRRRQDASTDQTLQGRRRSAEAATTAAELSLETLQGRRRSTEAATMSAELSLEVRRRRTENATMVAQSMSTTSKTYLTQTQSPPSSRTLSKENNHERRSSTIGESRRKERDTAGLQDVSNALRQVFDKY